MSTTFRSLIAATAIIVGFAALGAPASAQSRKWKSDGASITDIIRCNMVVDGRFIACKGN